MGEARRKEEAKSAGKPFHTTPREQLNLTAFLVNRKNTSADRRANVRVFEEFQIEDLVDRLIDASEAEDGTPLGGVKPSAWAGKEPIAIEVTGGTVDHLIKVLDTELQGPAAVILHGLEVRLKRCEAGTYEVPAELQSAPEAAQNGYAPPSAVLAPA